MHGQTLAKLLAANRVASYCIRTEYLALTVFGKSIACWIITISTRVFSGPSRSHYGRPSVYPRSREANTYCHDVVQDSGPPSELSCYLEVADLKVERRNVELQFDSTPLCSSRLTPVRL